MGQSRALHILRAKCMVCETWTHHIRLQAIIEIILKIAWDGREVGVKSIYENTLVLGTHRTLGALLLFLPLWYDLSARHS